MTNTVPAHARRSSATLRVARPGTAMDLLESCDAGLCQATPSAVLPCGAQRCYPEETMAEMLGVDDLQYDPNYLPRQEVDLQETVPHYAEMLAADPGFEFPPVLAVRRQGKGSSYLVLDGTHRLLAYLRAGRKLIPVIVEQLPQSRWFARAVELNAAHGRPLLTEDRRKVVRTLEAEGWKPERIAALLKIRVESVLPLRGLEKGGPRPFTRHPTNRLKGFKVKQPPKRPVSGGVIGAPPSTSPAATVPARGDLSEDVLMTLDHAIWLIQSGRADPKNKAVYERLAQLKVLLASL